MNAPVPPPPAKEAAPHSGGAAIAHVDDHLPTTRLPPLSAPPPPPLNARSKPGAAPRSSWAQVVSALSASEHGALRRQLGALAVCAGVVLALVGLFAVPRGEPVDATSSAVVIAALVVARAAGALAAVALGWGFVRLGERLLVGRG